MTPAVRIRVGLSHCDLGCAGYPFTVRWHSELSNALEGFRNPVSIESVAPEAIEMFGLVWTGRRDEFCIERMSFCGELFQCFAHGHDVVKDQQVSYEMVVLDELALLIAYALAASAPPPNGLPIFCASWIVSLAQRARSTSALDDIGFIKTPRG
jgi:hypothetical protein